MLFRSMNHNELFTDYHLSRPNDIRFLMCINDESLPVNLHNTVKLTEILTKIDVSKSEIKEIIKKIWLNDKNGIGTETETETETDPIFVVIVVVDVKKMNVEQNYIYEIHEAKETYLLYLVNLN